MASNLLESLANRQPPSALPSEAPRTPLVPSPALVDLRRFQLSLAVAFEEASLQVASELIRNAAPGESLYFAARQTFDDARHLEAFRFQLGAHWDGETALAGPLCDYFARSRAFAAQGAHLEGLTLLNLAFKRMAGSFHTWTARYWAPIDVPLSRLVRWVAAEEEVHVCRAAQLVRGGCADEVRRADLILLAGEARRMLQDVFRSYIDQFVSCFGVVIRLHRDRFRATEFAHGRLLLQVPEDEQATFILARALDELEGTLAKAGLMRQPV
jgi:hypothetical protein